MSKRVTKQGRAWDFGGPGRNVFWRRFLPNFLNIYKML